MHISWLVKNNKQYYHKVNEQWEYNTNNLTSYLIYVKSHYCARTETERCFHTPTLRHISQWRKPELRLLSRKVHVWHKCCWIQLGVFCMCPHSQFLRLRAVELWLQPQTLKHMPPWDTQRTLTICSLYQTLLRDGSAWLFHSCSKQNKRERLQRLWYLGWWLTVEQ